MKTKYTAKRSKVWKLKDGFTGLPKRVSIHGALPSNPDAYELADTVTIEVNANGRITYSNYFYGRRVTTFAEAEAVAAKLNAWVQSL